MFSRRWSIHNPLKGWTLHGMKDGEARLVVQTLSLAEKQICSVWRNGWDKWENFMSPSAEFLREPAAPLRAPNAPPPPSLSDSDEQTTTRVHLSHARPLRDKGRNYLRLEVTVPAQVVTASQSFSTETENVSEGGIKFIRPLPEWVAGYFTVILGLNEGPLEVTCMLIEDQGDAKTRVAVVETSDEESHLPRFKEWVRRLSADAFR